MTELYRHFDAEDRLLYVGISDNSLRRLLQHYGYSDWTRHIVKITIERFPTRAAALEAEAKAITNERPLHNRAGQPVPIEPAIDAAAEMAKFEAWLASRTQ